MVDWVKKLTGELIDIIQWLDDSNNTLVYRFERLNNEIKYGAKLTVREGQMAVFINEGQLADVYKPGMYTLTTQNMPILSTLKGWKDGFEAPVKAEGCLARTRTVTTTQGGTHGTGKGRRARWPAGASAGSRAVQGEAASRKAISVGHLVIA